MNSQACQITEVAAETLIVPAVKATSVAAGVTVTAGTGSFDYTHTCHLISERPLRRPNRTRPADYTASGRSAVERLVPPRDALRKLRESLPFPEGWYEETEKPF